MGSINVIKITTGQKKIIIAAIIAAQRTIEHCVSFAVG